MNEQQLQKFMQITDQLYNDAAALSALAQLCTSTSEPQQTIDTHGFGILLKTLSDKQTTQLINLRRIMGW